MKKLLFLVMMLGALAAQAQWTFSGDTMFIDTLDRGTKYMKVDYYTTTGAFVIAKGAQTVSICNVGAANGDITLRASSELLFPNQCLNLPATAPEGLRRVVGLRVPRIVGDATGTTFTILIQY